MENPNGQSAQEETATITTTLGELVEAVTDIALKAAKTEAEGYELASLTIEKLLRDQRRRELMEP